MGNLFHLSNEVQPKGLQQKFKMLGTKKKFSVLKGLM